MEKRPRKKKPKVVRIHSRYNNHHLTPRSRSGSHEEENILRLKAERHFYWHQLFRKPNGEERTLEEIIALLMRVHKAKGRCTGKLVKCLLEVKHGDKRKASRRAKAALPRKANRVSRIPGERRSPVSTGA